MRLSLPILTLLALVVLAASAPAKVREFEIIQKGNLRVKFGAEFTPSTLPRKRPAPITVEVAGAIATTDGSHPPPLRKLEIEINRQGRISGRGLPVCTAPLLQSTTTKQALARCGNARVGSGSFRAQLALGTGKDVPATGRIVVFNSRTAGKPSLLIHLFIGVPVRVTMIVPITIGHRQEGVYGTVLRAFIPKLGGGLGSVTEIDLKLGRRYTFGGQRRSYLAAACSAPAELEEGPFRFLRGSFRFEAHRKIETPPLTKFCRVRKP
ncbi:MAG TPA: hypothetical protein VFX44_01940 [Solirubrobacterales bacterium]|nr:hypothetical protein [Solirubrobacterales bacterium]